MSIALPYFITILMSFPLALPTDGWIAWKFAFPNKVTCEEFLASEHETLFVNVTRAFISMPHVINDFQCMTNEEGAKANKALGHNLLDTMPGPPRYSPKI